MLTMVEVQVKTSIFLHFQTFLLVKMIYKKKTGHFLCLGVETRKVVPGLECLQSQAMAIH